VADEKGAEAIRDKNRRIREEAAQKRRAKRDEEKVAARRPTLGQLEASEIVDDALARTTHAVTGWLRSHFTLVQWIVVGGFAGGIGWQVYVYHRGKVEGRTTDALVIGVDQERARVGDTPSEADPMTGLTDPRPIQKSDEERLRAAEAAYRKVSEGDTMRVLARLGLAGVLFDQGKHKEALAEYKAVRDTKLAQEDTDVRARVIEGIGLTQEALKDTAGAKKTFHELTNQDSAQLSALGLYHQARIEQQEGASDKAKEHLKAALKKLTDAKLQQPYVEQVARELLASIDPTALPPPSPEMMSPEVREQLKQLEALKKQADAAKKAAAEAAKDPTLNDISAEQLKKILGEANKKIPQPAPSAAPPASSAP
jgi:tetratricopeptide (TPR) repeat protein